MKRLLLLATLLYLSRGNATVFKSYADVLGWVADNNIQSALEFIEKLPPEIQRTLIIVKETQAKKKQSAEKFPRIQFAQFPSTNGEPFLTFITDTNPESPFYNDIHIKEHSGAIDFSRITPEAYAQQDINFKFFDLRFSEDKSAAFKATPATSPSPQKCATCHDRQEGDNPLFLPNWNTYKFWPNLDSSAVSYRENPYFKPLFKRAPELTNDYNSLLSSNQIAYDGAVAFHVSNKIVHDLLMKGAKLEQLKKLFIAILASQTVCLQTEADFFPKSIRGLIVNSSQKSKNFSLVEYYQLGAKDIALRSWKYIDRFPDNPKVTLAERTQSKTPSIQILQTLGLIENPSELLKYSTIPSIEYISQTDDAPSGIFTTGIDPIFSESLLMRIIQGLYPESFREQYRLIASGKSNKSIKTLNHELAQQEVKTLWGIPDSEPKEMCKKLALQFSQEFEILLKAKENASH